MLLRRLKPLFSIILLLAILCTLPIPVQAAYENTYKNTGNMRNDIIGVALTQVGYREGANNYTKYGVWFGRPNSAWCGMFISWCANQAGIPTSIIRRNGIASPSSFGLSYKSGSSYRPQKGDLFFTKTFSHAGLVYYTDGNYFYTVEGNTNNAGSEGIGVFIRRRKISDYYFSSPNYRNSNDNNHSYVTGYDTAHPHKEYKYCSHCSDKYYTGKTKASTTCKTCIQAACSHKYGNWTKTSSSKHTKVCTLCGKTVTESHNWKNGDIVKAPNCKYTGQQEQTCSVCKATKTVTLAATGKHTYSSAVYLNETSHNLVCSVCGDKEKENHKTENWAGDLENHWKVCTVCSEVLLQAAHEFPDGCTSACTTCGFVQPGSHQVGDEFAYDDSGHWKICEKCGHATENAEHTYNSDCDISCESCDYIRENEIEHDFTVFKDQTGHWKLCNVCNLLTETEPHTPDSKARSWETQLCTECEYVLRSADEHVHNYSIAQYDSQHHWGECECGETMPKVVHSWDITTGICDECGAEYVPELSDDSEFLLYAGIGAVILIGVPLIVLLLVKIIRKKRY